MYIVLKRIILSFFIFHGVSFASDTSSLTFNAKLTSDYAGKGITQTYGQPAIQLGADLDMGNGFYAGAWGSNVSDKIINGASIELDAYLGYASKFGYLNYNVGINTINYPGAKNRATDRKYDFQEGYVSLTLAPLTVKYKSVN